MLKVGITGGIGSGKTTVCKIFEILGIPVFYADLEARRLMETDAGLIRSIKKLFGEEAYKENQLNRAFIAGRAFNDPELLQQLNAYTHPVVIESGNKWMEQQTSPYTLKEAALFFESGSHASMDIMIGVTAPLELRIARTICRDHISKEEVLKRMSRQMDESEKMKLCDMVISNDEIQALIPQVLAIHDKLINSVTIDH